MFNSVPIKYVQLSIPEGEAVNPKLANVYFMSLSYTVQAVQQYFSYE